jgi:uncharacterized protein
MNAGARVASPCIDVCTLDESGSVCIGCLRTRDEIALWSQLDDSDRAWVLSSLPERRRLVEGRPAASMRQRCPKCGAEFGCGANGPHNDCWCASFPPVKPQAGQTCLCPACLAAAPR